MDALRKTISFYFKLSWKEFRHIIEPVLLLEAVIAAIAYYVWVVDKDKSTEYLEWMRMHPEISAWPAIAAVVLCWLYVVFGKHNRVVEERDNLSVRANQLAERIKPKLELIFDPIVHVQKDSFPNHEFRLFRILVKNNGIDAIGGVSVYLADIQNSDFIRTDILEIEDRLQRIRALPLRKKHDREPYRHEFVVRSGPGIEFDVIRSTDIWDAPFQVCHSVEVNPPNTNLPLGTYLLTIVAESYDMAEARICLEVSADADRQLIVKNVS